MPRHDNKVLNFLFDLRMIIAILFAIYGVICVIWGAAFTSGSELAKAGGVNVNLYGGIGMLVVAALFVWWALAKPIEQQAAAHSLEESEAEAQRNL